MIPAVALAGAETETSGWVLSGDGRIRGEFRQSEVADQDGSSLLLRLRVGAEASVPGGLAAGLAIGTGDPDDLREPDAGFGSGDREPGMRLDQAWIRWTPDALPGLAVAGGRMPMPLLCVRDLIFDPDWNPSGLSLAWSPPGERWRPHLRGAAFWLFEEADRRLFQVSGQAGVEFRHGPEWRLLGGTGFHVVNAEGHAVPLDRASAAGNASRPSESGASPALARDYRILEPFAQATWDPWFPVTVYGQAAVNTAASSDKTGWLAGATIGRARAIGALEFGWNVRRLEADAAFAALADSDFAGGGTDVEGHAVYARYHAVRNVWVGVAWSTGLRDPDGERLAEKLWQIDLAARF